jgi:ribonuclease-3
MRLFVCQVIECKGPTNTRVYTVAVYFRGQRLAKDTGHSIQQAEMNAAKLALEQCSHLFPHLTYQRKVLERSFKFQGKAKDFARSLSTKIFSPFL